MNFIQERKRLIGVAANLDCDIPFTAKLVETILRERLIRTTNIVNAIDNILLSNVTPSEKVFLERIRINFNGAY